MFKNLPNSSIAILDGIETDLHQENNPSADATMGTQCSVPTTLSVCQPTSGNDPRAGYRLSRHRHIPDPQGGFQHDFGQARCSYIDPALSSKRLSLTRNGQVRYELTTPWSNGTTQVIFESLDFISRLVVLVPRPRVHLTRFHGLFAPNSNYLPLVTPLIQGEVEGPHPAYSVEKLP